MYLGLLNTQQIVDLLDTAYGGGSNYWLRGVETSMMAVKKNSELLADFIEKQVNTGECFVFHLHSEFNGSKQVSLSVETAHNRLHQFQSFMPHWYEQAVSDNWDASTADVFLQFIVFGDTVYG